MKRRVIGTVLLGLGVTLLVLAAGLRFYVAPSAAQLPYDLKPSIGVVVAKNATFAQVVDGAPKIRTGDLQSTTEVRPQPVLTQQKMVGDLAGKAVVWDVYSSTVNLSDKSVVDASSLEIALDRKTGAAAAWDGAWINTSGADKGKEPKATFKGHSYKLPFGAEKKSYDFWDETMGRTYPIEFKAVETVEGNEAYRYQQVLPLQEAPLDALTGAVLAATFGQGSTGGKTFYSNTRTIWVEPTTGQFLNVREQRHLEYRAGNGTKTTLLEADFSYDKATLTSTASSVKQNVDQLVLISVTLPIVVAVIGLLFVISAIVLLRRRSDPETADDQPTREFAELQG